MHVTIMLKVIASSAYQFTILVIYMRTNEMDTGSQPVIQQTGSSRPPLLMDADSRLAILSMRRW